MPEIIKQNPNSRVFVPNYNGFCEVTYEAWRGYATENDVLDWAFAPGDDKSMCYDKDGQNYDPANPDAAGYDGHRWIDMPNDGFGLVDDFDIKCGEGSATYGSENSPSYKCSTVDFSGDNLDVDYEGGLTNSYDYTGFCDGSIYSDYDECIGDDILDIDDNDIQNENDQDHFNLDLNEKMNEVILDYPPIKLT
mgnify:CR=1 FL=1